MECAICFLYFRFLVERSELPIFLPKFQVYIHPVLALDKIHRKIQTNTTYQLANYHNRFDFTYSNESVISFVFKSRKKNILPRNVEKKTQPLL